MKKLVLGFLLLSSALFAGDYTSQGNNVYYKGKKIGHVNKEWSGWKDYCERSQYGEPSTSGSKEKAMQKLVARCKTNWAW